MPGPVLASVLSSLISFPAFATKVVVGEGFGVRTGCGDGLIVTIGFDRVDSGGVIGFGWLERGGGAAGVGFIMFWAEVGFGVEGIGGGGVGEGEEVIPTAGFTGGGVPEDIPITRL